jgi:Mg2+-importing ATPase
MADLLTRITRLKIFRLARREKVARTRRDPPARPALAVVEAASGDLETVLERLQTSPQGLTRVQALTRRTRCGLNEIAHEKPPRWYVQLLHAFHNPFILLLLSLAAVSLLTYLAGGDADELKSTLIIAVMVVISVAIRFVQEFRSGRAAEKLKALVSTTATVSRPGPQADVPASVPEAFGIRLHPPPPELKEVPLRMLVPGDVVHLSAGDMVPADVRLLASKDLFVSQSILTGESLPVEKREIEDRGSRIEDRAPLDPRSSILDPRSSIFDRPTVCFMGTNVVSGTARAVVVATGSDTYFGTLAKHLVGHRAPTSFDCGVSGVSWLLIRFMLVMVPLIFFINGFTKGDWGDAFFFGLSVAVGLTPEMLPMIVTATLARGAVSMARRKVIVKRLSAIQNFGAMDVLCTDKTGTLTQDKVVLLRHLDIHGKDDDGVLEYAYLNSYFQTGLKNLLDEAVLKHEDLARSKNLTERYLKTDEVPFDFNRRRMSVWFTRCSGAGTCSSARGRSRRSWASAAPRCATGRLRRWPRTFVGKPSNWLPR